MRRGKRQAIPKQYATGFYKKLCLEYLLTIVWMVDVVEGRASAFGKDSSDSA
jgi:hypothetical protein